MHEQPSYTAVITDEAPESAKEMDGEAVRKPNTKTPVRRGRRRRGSQASSSVSYEPLFYISNFDIVF